MSHKIRSYTSDLSDGQWKRMKWLLPKVKGPGRPPMLSKRAVVNAILYIVVTGCQWHNLPREFPHPKSVYYHFRKWSLSGVWQRINRALVFLQRRRIGRFARPSAGVMDSQSVKTVLRGEQRGYDGHKKVKGRKRHLLTDTQGHLLGVVVMAANRSDREGVEAVLNTLEPLMAQRLRKIWADKGYQSEGLRTELQALGIELEIVVAAPDQVGFAVQPHRWVVERTFAWFAQARRLSKDYECCPISSEGMIYLAAIRTLLRRLPE